MLTLLPLLLACSNAFHFDDDVQIELIDLDPTNDLHTPYVVGSKITFSATGGRDDHDWAGWSLALAEDTGVIELLDSSYDDYNIEAVGHALAEGEATLQLLDDQGEVALETLIEVGQPDRIELHAAGSQKHWVPSNIDDVEADPRQVVVDGLASFEVRYYRGEQRLYGKEAFSAMPSADITIEQDSSDYWTDADWLQLRTHTPGLHEVAIGVGGEVVATVQFEGVEASVVDTITLYEESSGAAEAGDQLSVLAWAVDADGEPVHGVECNWNLDGYDSGNGDLFYYTYAPSNFVPLVAEFDGQTFESEIEASGGFANSTNHLSCSASGSAAGGLVALLATLGVARRRRS